MSPRQLHFVFLALGLFVGGWIGAYLRSLTEVPPPPSAPLARAECPPCPRCPAVPAAPTEARPPEPAPTSTTAGPEPEPEPWPPAVEPPPGPTLPGLAGPAMKLALDAFRREAADCARAAAEAGREAPLVLDLTVTATGGLGRIREVSLVDRGVGAAEVEPCVRAAARRVEFLWSSSEGESRLRVPFKVR